MFLPPLSVFTQCCPCAPVIPHANFVEQFVTFAERHLDKSRLGERYCLHSESVQLTYYDTEKLIPAWSETMRVSLFDK